MSSPNKSENLILSEVTEGDPLQIAKGYYLSFPSSWLDFCEPEHLRPKDKNTRHGQFAECMRP
ncbi:hypothetical protein P154DRAFT_524906 [Amniculicola lignicola CBS 123094]|uniref:Uncharacterized protein n=1 Tax=Amniculicola lignicola CBS 123094 TaxID=1392246 RepID=A0A6A5W7R9_9PLEO|nr:hypothetical protein P154DRAFT_524906 [Amniculicola lignicola CBS 123094]